MEVQALHRGERALQPFDFESDQTTLQTRWRIGSLSSNHIVSSVGHVASAGRRVQRLPVVLANLADVLQFFDVLLILSKAICHATLMTCSTSSWQQYATAFETNENEAAPTIRGRVLDCTQSRIRGLGRSVAVTSGMPITQRNHTSSGGRVGLCVRRGFPLRVEPF
jgi:hypothetical protein